MSASKWAEQKASPLFIALWLSTLITVVVAAMALLDFSKNAPASDVAERSRGSFNLGHLCRAAISMVMLRPVNIINVDSLSETVTSVSYIRPDDGTLWRQKCKTDGDHIVWAAIDGRWRDKYDWEERLVFSLSNSGQTLKVRQIFPDGSGATREFGLDDFS